MDRRGSQQSRAAAYDVGGLDFCVSGRSTAAMNDSQLQLDTNTGAAAGSVATSSRHRARPQRDAHAPPRPARWHRAGNNRDRPHLWRDGVRFEHHAKQTQLTSFGSALFWTSTQLLTVSSSILNPISTPGRVLDVAMEAYAITVIAGLAGSVGAFLVKRGHELEQAAEKVEHAA